MNKIKNWIQNHKRVYGFFLLTAFIMALLLIFFPPRFSLEIGITDVKGSGSILVYQKESNSVFRSYYNQWLPMNSTTTSLSFDGLQYDLKHLRIDVDGVESVSIDRIRIYSTMFPVYEMTGRDIYDNIIKVHGVRATFNNGVTTFKRMSIDDPYCLFVQKSLFTPQFVISYLALMLGSAALLSFCIKSIFKKLYNRITDSGLLLPLLYTLYTSYLSLIINESLEVIRIEYLLIYLIINIAGLMVFISMLGIPVGTIVTNTILSGLYIVNSYVEQYRGRSIFISDFKAVSVALKVANTYSFKLSNAMICLIILSCIVVYLLIKVNKNKLNKWIRVLFLPVGVVAILLVFNTEAYRDAKFSSWDTDIMYHYKRQGMILSMVKYYQQYKVEKPENYSKEEANRILNNANNNEKLFETYGNKPDTILMIMNESFSNMEQFNTDLDFSTTPYLDSLEDNIIRGNVYVSVRGGGTCNTEFESLTGLSMSLLPLNIYPFQNYLNKPVASIASYFTDLGFKTSSLHLESGNNWNRKQVYSNLGLTPFYTIDDYDEDEIETVKTKATDSFNYKKLIEIEQNMNSDLEFIFNVTIQNHGGYDLTEDMITTVDLSRFGNHSSAEVFLSLMKMSDEAIHDLVDYYENSDKKTMIVIFGDHQPTLKSETEEWLMRDSEGILDKYRTPFYIITNYPIQSTDIGGFSSNYIPYLIAEASGYPITPFYRFIGNVYKHIPIITSYGVIDENQEYYESIDVLPDDYQHFIEEYKIVQYDVLFGK